MMCVMVVFCFVFLLLFGYVWEMDCWGFVLVVDFGLLDDDWKDRFDVGDDFFVL